MSSKHNNFDTKLLHDFNNYMVGQKLNTQICLELLNAGNTKLLKTTLENLLKQQDELSEPLIQRLKTLLSD
jgi:hypothetical protein